ncbi:unnamed protein product [Dracunculus medinensis]|uniref:MAGUK p55 subfamily member 6 n=1 Tax=Dracunculus medinensis TaxID=318479 RepID=A0A0N4UIA0_DRAME|nr:unnamed protein product [Dracunculus medinensis]
MEAEVKKLKLNADNLAVCLHSLLKRIEQLEGSAGHDKSNGTASDINISPSKSIDEALGALLAEETESAVNGPKSDVKIICNETVSIDPDTGLKKRTKVTERILTTKTFHAIAVNDGETHDCNYISFSTNEPRFITLKSNPFNDIRYHRQDGAFFITEVKPASSYAKDLHCGDAVVEINGQPSYTIRNLNSLHGELKLKVVSIPIHQAPSIFYRAIFDYDPNNDSYIPQKWSGLALKKGEVIQVMSQDDKWMQARKVNSVDKVGLVPINFASERVAMLTPYGRRVLILLGAPGVGRRTLKSMLLSYMPQYFATVTPLTSRAPKPKEEEGREYYFRTKAEILNKIRAGEMVEWGELDNQLYGTSADTIRDCIRGGRMCVLDCAPQALRYLYNKEFMPFVVVISPPDLTDQWQINKAKPNPRTEEQLQMTIEENKLLLSSEYAKMFHLILPNRNIDITFRRLIDALNQLKSEIQWVPEVWLSR